MRSWVLGVCVGLMVLLGAGYVVWWAATPGDCTSIAPTAGSWRADGVVVDVRGECALVDGDRIGSVDGEPIERARAEAAATEVRYGVIRDGDKLIVGVPLGRADPWPALREGWATLLFVVALFGVAGYAYLRRPGEPAAGALVVLAGGLLASSVVFLLGLPARWAGPGWPRWLYLSTVELVYTVGWAGLLAFTALFPRPRRRPALAYAAPPVVLVLGAGFLALTSDPAGPGWVGQVITVQAAITVLIVLAAVGGAVARLSECDTDPVARQQLRWVAGGGLVSASLGLAGWFVPELLTGAPLLPDSWNGAAGLPAVAGMAVAMLRYRMFDLERVVARAVVYAALTSCVVTVYLGVVTGLAGVFSASTPVSVIAAATVAITVNPLRIGLQRAVNRLMYGDRDDPYAALRRLGHRLEAAETVPELLPAAAADVARALRVPYVRIELSGDGGTTRAAESGRRRPPGGELLAVGLTHRGESVGRLLVAPRAPGERHTAGDRRLLTDLARHLAAAARVVTLTDALQRSREQLVIAREEDRRTMRRNLHDDIGPGLAGLALLADAARRRPQTEADEMWLRVRQEAQALAERIRLLAYELRPPALDELGLVAALRERAHEHELVRVEIDAPDNLEPLPAAVEVAAYRIVVEAMTNVARHAAAARCGIRLRRTEDAVELEITDDGTGLPNNFRAGVGVTAMRERAAELGGTCTIGSADHGRGTVVRARLPVAATSPGRTCP